MCDARSIYATPCFGVDSYPQRVRVRCMSVDPYRTHVTPQYSSAQPLRPHSASVHTTTPPIIVDSTKGLDNDYADSTSGKCVWKHEIKVSYDTSTLDPIYSSFLSGYHDPNLANGIACQQERSRASCHNRVLVRSPGFHTLMRNEQLLLWCFGSRRYRRNF